MIESFGIDSGGHGQARGPIKGHERKAREERRGKKKKKKRKGKRKKKKRRRRRRRWERERKSNKKPYNKNRLDYPAFRLNIIIIIIYSLYLSSTNFESHKKVCISLMLITL